MPLRRLISVENTLVGLKTRKEVDAFLGVLLTPHERDTFQNRWSAFQLILKGETQRSVRDLLGVSIATASRSARVVQTHKKIIEALLHKI